MKDDSEHIVQKVGDKQVKHIVGHCSQVFELLLG